MSDFYMIIFQPIRLSLLQMFCEMRMWQYYLTSLFTRPCLLWPLPFSEIESLPRWTELSVQTGDWICCIPVYLDYCNVTSSGSGFIDWHHAFLVMETTLKAWNKEICDYLYFERSRTKWAILLEHPSKALNIHHAAVMLSRIHGCSRRGKTFKNVLCWNFHLAYLA